MIGIIQNLIKSPSIYSVASNTPSQVAMKTVCQTVGQPTFIVINNNLDPQTKMYSTTKEVLYQLLCLGINFGFVIPLFQKRSFSIAKKLYKNEPVFNVFKNTKEFKKYCDLERIEDKDRFLKNINPKLRPDDINERFGRGMTNLMSIIGSVLGLAVLASWISKPLVRPILKVIGIDEPKK